MEFPILFYLVYWVQAISAFDSSTKIIFDFTEPLNMIMAEKISTDEFITSANTAFELAPSQPSPYTLLYATDRNNPDKMVDQALNATKALSNSLNSMTENFTIVLSFTIAVGKAPDKNPEIKEYVEKTFTKNALMPKILINFSDGVNCSDIIIFRDYTEWAKFTFGTTTSVGVGFDEARRNCSRLRVVIDNFSNFKVVTFKFGQAFGVLDFRNQFQSRMHELVQADIGKSFTCNNCFYYPSPESFTGNKEKSLLIGLANDWINSTKHFIVQVPIYQTDRDFLIPSLVETTQDCLDTYHHTWLSLSLGGSQRFKTVIVSPGQMLNWTSEINSFHRNPRKPLFESGLNLIVEFPDSNEQGCAYNWTAFETAMGNGRLFNSEEHREKVRVKALVFPIEQTVHAEYARQMSAKFTVGCTIWLRESLTNVTEVINACKSINGSLYILKASFVVTAKYILKPNKTQELIHRLDNIRRFREALLVQQNESTVFFSVEFSHSFQSPDLLHFYNHVCSKNAMSIGSVTDAIVSWANFQSFGVVFRPFPNTVMGFSSRFIKFLRQLNYPLEVQEDTESFTLQSMLAATECVMTSPKLFGNVLAETCIINENLGLEVGLGVPDNFFLNGKFGAIFDSEDSMLSNVTTVAEYATMFQYICHRFDVVEIITGKNFELLSNAVDLVLKLQPDVKTSIYMHFTPAQTNLSELRLFLDVVANSRLFQKTNLLKGIHIDVPDLNYRTVANANSVLQALELAQSYKIPIGIFLNSKVECTNTIERWIIGASPDDLGWAVLTKTSYVVCSEDMIGGESKGSSDMDVRLYVNRLLSTFLPNLWVHYRLDDTRLVADSKSFNNDERFARINHLATLRLFKCFGFGNNISFFIANAFHGSENKNGWWEIKNYSDLANPKAYVERETKYFQRQMWYPTDISILEANYLRLNSRLDAQVHGNSTSVIIGSSVGSVLLLVFAALGLILFLRYRKLRQFLSDSEIKEFLNGRARLTSDDAIGVEMGAMGNTEYMKFNREHNLNLSDVTIEMQNMIGSGAFGTVFRGIVKGKPAAIKQPNRDCSKTAFKSVLTEVKVLSYIKEHDNVVEFLGAYVKEIHQGLIYVATELCSNGSLESFLRKHVHVTSSETACQNTSTENCLTYHDLHMFSMQISNGMDYIASKHVVHGDLSTRNVLLDEHLTCKIGDFGLSRKLYEYQKYVKTSQEPLPWKWLAYESLVKMEFTTKTDVWSFGVTLWEIYCLGKIPFSGLNWSPGFADELKNGLRLPAPEYASEEIYSKMQECWNLDPELRPTFVDLGLFFRELCNTQYTML